MAKVTLGHASPAVVRFGDLPEGTLFRFVEGSYSTNVERRKVGLTGAPKSKEHGYYLRAGLQVRRCMGDIEVIPMPEIPLVSSVNLELTPEEAALVYALVGRAGRGIGVMTVGAANNIRHVIWREMFDAGAFSNLKSGDHSPLPCPDGVK